MLRSSCHLSAIPFLILVGLTAELSAQNPASTQVPPILATEAASRFVGGPDFRIKAIQVDAAGNIYVAGDHLPRTVNNSTVLQGPELYKLSPQFEEAYRIPIGGDGPTAFYNQVSAMALDASGNIYVTGFTDSLDFPTVNPIQANLGGLGDVFLAKFDSDGNRLFSTYIGGSSMDLVDVLAVDGDGNAFVGGRTLSPNFPLTPNAYLTELDPMLPNSGSQTFLLKVATDSPKLEFSTLLGGGSKDGPYSIAAVAGGDVFFLMQPSATVFPVTDGSMNDGRGQILGRLSADGSRLVYASYATASPDIYMQLLLDRDGNLLLVGGVHSVKIDVATNTVIGMFQFGGSAAAIDQEGNRLGILNQNSNMQTSGNGLSVGTNRVTEISLDGSTLFSTGFPYGVADVGIAAGPNGAIVLAGSSGMVSRILPDESDVSKALPRIMGIGNAAAVQESGAVVPGEIVSLYGAGIGSEAAMTTEIGSNGLVSTSLGGIEVDFNGTPGRMLYSGPQQINVVAPFDLGQGDSVVVEVLHDGNLWASIAPSASVADPAVFLYQNQYAAALNEDQTVNSRGNPAAPGSIVTVYLTGMGDMMGASFQDGEVFDPATPIANLPTPKLAVKVIAPDGRDSAHNPGQEILYLGQAPAAVAGVIQLNFRLPTEPLTAPGLSTPIQPFFLETGTSFASSFVLWVAEPAAQ